MMMEGEVAPSPALPRTPLPALPREGAAGAWLRFQQFLQLQEQSFAGLVTIRIHVELGAGWQMLGDGGYITRL